MGSGFLLTSLNLRISTGPSHEVVPKQPYVAKPEQGEKCKTKEKQPLALLPSLLCGNQLSIDGLYRRNVHSKAI
jgi:hypothetical protein